MYIRSKKGQLKACSSTSNVALPWNLLACLDARLALVAYRSTLRTRKPDRQEILEEAAQRSPHFTVHGDMKWNMMNKKKKKGITGLGGSELNVPSAGYPTNVKVLHE